MASFDSADLLSRLRREIRQPSGTVFPADADLYVLLGEAQIKVMLDFDRIVPRANIGVPTLMTTADAGYTYTFGTDGDGNALFPLGAVMVYRQQTDVPDFPMVEGVDYLMEGDKIRFPNNRPYSGSTAPYWQGVTMPLKLDGSTAPVLKPIQARMLLVYEAAVRYQTMVGGDTTGFSNKYDTAFLQIVGALQKQYARQASIAATNPAAGPARARWWRWPRTY